MTVVTTPGSCAICGGKPGRELLRITVPDRFERHAGVPANGYERRWVECSDCGVAANAYADGVLEKLSSLSAGYYEVDFQAGTIGGKYAMVMALPRARSDNAQRVGRIRRFIDGWWGELPGPMRALDIGAGTGVFLSRFLDDAGKAGQFWSAVAVEPDPVAATHLRSLGMFEVVDRLFTADLGLSGFDLVTLNKVVEHLPDPVALLQHAATALGPGRVMYVEVPDVATLYHRPPTDNILGPLHRHLYDVRSLDLALRRAGMHAIGIERLFEPSGKISLAAFAVTSATFAQRATGEAP